MKYYLCNIYCKTYSWVHFFVIIVYLLGDDFKSKYVRENYTGNRLGVLQDVVMDCGSFHLLRIFLNNLGKSKKKKKFGTTFVPADGGLAIRGLTNDNNLN